MTNAKHKEQDERIDQVVYDHYMDSLMERFERTVKFLEYKGDKMEIMVLRNAFSRRFERALESIEDKTK